MDKENKSTEQITLTKDFVDGCAERGITKEEAMQIAKALRSIGEQYDRRQREKEDNRNHKISERNMAAYEFFYGKKKD